MAVLSAGACVHGHDESADDHYSANATDSVSTSAAGSAAATASSYASAGKNTQTFFLDSVPGGVFECAAFLIILGEAVSRSMLRDL